MDGQRGESQQSQAQMWVHPKIARQSILTLIQRDRTIHTYAQLKLTNQFNNNVFGLWEEAGVAGTGRTIFFLKLLLLFWGVSDMMSCVQSQQLSTLKLQHDVKQVFPNMLTHFTGGFQLSLGETDYKKVVAAEIILAVALVTSRLPRLPVVSHVSHVSHVWKTFVLLSPFTYWCCHIRGFVATQPNSYQHIFPKSA